MMELINQTDVAFWSAAFLACLLGAMSPGPSLAVVIRHTLATDRTAGFYAAISHGIGIGIYALITTLGLSVLIQENQYLFNIIQLFGSFFLLLLAIKLLISSASVVDNNNSSLMITSNYAAIRDGLIIALVNPKILLFFTALFSQFVRLDSNIWEKLWLAGIAGGVDMLWYMLVALIISRTESSFFSAKGYFWLDKLFGLILAFIALKFISQLVGFAF
jgi:threonine/homoserine/homoserine lactone efflux protein